MESLLNSKPIPFDAVKAVINRNLIKGNPSRNLENPETDTSSVQSRSTKSFRQNLFSSFFSSKNLDKEEIPELLIDHGVNETSLGKPYPNYYYGHTVGNDQFKCEVSDPAVDLKRKVNSKEKTSLYDKEATKSLHRAEDVQSRELFELQKNIKKYGKIAYDLEKIIGGGSFGLGVFEGYYDGFNEKVAIKRIIRNFAIKESAIKQEVDLMKMANGHPNILRCIGFEMSEEFLLIASELCQGTLEDYVKGTYNGPKFVPEKGMLLQMAKGLVHLHSVNVVHRDIKPTNILIYVPQNTVMKPVVKLADFGLSKVLKNDKEVDFSNSNVRNPSGTQGWMAPELYESRRFDSRVDIFPLGCVYVYTMTDGKHPFGDDHIERLIRIRRNEPIFLTQEDLKAPYSFDSKALDLVRSMIEWDPKYRPTAKNIVDHDFFKDCIFEEAKGEEKMDFETSNPTSNNEGNMYNSAIPQNVQTNFQCNTGEFEYDRDQQIGDHPSREHRVTVFKGRFNRNIPAAVKRYQKTKDRLGEESIIWFKETMEFFFDPENRHPNLIRYYGSAEDEKYRYLAMEWCECSVADIIDQKRKIETQAKTNLYFSILRNLHPKEILRQSNEAVSFLHSLKRTHRDLHPDNFLISCIDPNTEDYLIKLTDFGPSKIWEIDPNQTGEIQSYGWVAPEILLSQDYLRQLSSLKDYNEENSKIDAFTMGCYYFYVLSGGKHPFGNGVDERKARISRYDDQVYQMCWDGGLDWILYSKLHKEEAVIALSLIKKMVKFEPSARTPLKEISEHSFFRSDHSYEIYDNPRSKTPGLCVIITQSNYYTNHSDNNESVEENNVIQHRGMLLDSKNLESTFNRFGYDVLQFRDLRAKEIEAFLSTEKLMRETGESLDKFASLVVCIISHGDKGVVFGVDGTHVPLYQLQYVFNNDRCPAFKGKPKIFIILACQGNQDQLVLERHDPSRMQINSKKSTINVSSRWFTMQPLTDFLSLISTMETFQTYYSNSAGSEFISHLCDTLISEYNDSSNADFTKKKDLVHLLSSVVIPRIARSGIQATINFNGRVLPVTIKQTPEFHSTLTKTIRFRPYHRLGTARLVYVGEGIEYLSSKHGRKEKPFVVSSDDIAPS